MTARMGAVRTVGLATATTVIAAGLDVNGCVARKTSFAFGATCYAVKSPKIEVH